VLAVPARPNREFYEQLVAAGYDARLVGDALAPRRAHAAVIDGHAVGSCL
jgi:2,4-dienoyl-CoA reductase (NADPH2)